MTCTMTTSPAGRSRIPVRSPPPVERDGRQVGALVHDPAVRYRAELLRVVTAAARLSLENVAPRAELLAQLAEVRASRARIVTAAEAERRRVERNLHDGAQQHLLLAALGGRLDLCSPPGRGTTLAAHLPCE